MFPSSLLNFSIKKDREPIVSRPQKSYCCLTGDACFAGSVLLPANNQFETGNLKYFYGIEKMQLQQVKTWRA